MDEKQHARGLRSGALLLRVYIEQHNLTQAQFAEKAKIDESLISRYLAGDVVPGLANAAAIVKATEGEVNGQDWLSAAA